MRLLARTRRTLAFCAVATALALVASKAEAAKSSDCRPCHLQTHDAFKETIMGKIILVNPRDSEEAKGCETCHGPADSHVAAADKGEGKDLTKIISFKKHSLQTVAEKNDICMKCHSNDSYKMLWTSSAHQRNGVACVDCHTIMTSVSKERNLAKVKIAETCFQCHTQRKAQSLRTNHMPYREGKMTCSDCHNPHGGVGPKMLKEATVNETCYTCHMEKRGPFLWEHAPVRENCGNCHDPHGTNNHKSTVAKMPFLCQRCHANTNHPSNAYYDPRAVTGTTAALPPTGAWMYNRGCINCHQQVHGSNSPSGPRFNR